MIAPWWIHNEIESDHLVRPNLGNGTVFYSGNNPLNTSGGGAAYGQPSDHMDLPPFLTISDPISRNHATKTAALDFIPEKPGHFVQMTGGKFVRFWRLRPYSPSYESPFIIVLSLASYGIVLPLALIALIRARRQSLVRLLPILMLAATLSIFSMITIDLIRLRLPEEPFLILLAAGTLTGARQFGFHPSKAGGPAVP